MASSGNAPQQAEQSTLEQTLHKAISLHREHRFQDAERLYRAILQSQPNHPDANYNLGVLGVLAGQPAAALPYFHAALEAAPGEGRYWLSYADALLAAGRARQAQDILQRALQRGFNSPEAHALRQKIEIAVQNTSGEDKALSEIDQLVALFSAGDYAGLESRARAMVEQDPSFGFAWKALSVALMEQGKDSLPELQKAVALLPEDEAAHNNLGNALKGLGQMDGAAACYRKALALKPDFAEAYNNLGNVLADIWQMDGAVECYRRALAIKPQYIDAHSNLLFALNYHPDLSAEEIYRAYREYDAGRGLPLRASWRAHGNNKDPERRLRVGYVSPDFHGHSCQYFLEPLLARHDKTRMEVYAYADLFEEDEVTVRYRKYADHWVSANGMSDEALSERIRSDGIDILVDLAGHTVNNRLLAFARKPAPVSVSWLGYGYTTGLSAIDYFLTDVVCAPAGSEELFAERPWRIPTPAYVYRPGDDMGEVGNLPALQRGYITFGTLTRAVRINHRTVRVWAEILKAVPNSRLVIDSSSFKSEEMQEWIGARFAEHGIVRERLTIGFHSPPWEILRGIDIGLDCFPHNSGTTLFETLYMGLPYITLAGRPSVGRMGGSILHGVGHPEWIAENEADYVAKAVDLAGDVTRLSRIRANLREQMEASPLMDEAGFARKMEEAYRRMWKIWCGQGD
jgi:predicted O-linked N-acetylglucosamine transferase (SPINDLY family)